MGKSADKLLEYLGGSRDAWRQTISTFAEPDVLQLAADMRLEEKAAERARQVEAAHENAGPDVVEQEIVHDICQRHRIAQSEYSNAMDLYEARLRSSAIGDEVFVSIKRVGEDGLNNFEAQAVEDRLPLDGREEAFKLVQAQLRSFVRKHGLEGTAPIMVSSQEKKRSLLWIAVMVLLETALNGMFFAQGSKMGFIGGAVEALGLSVLNVALAAAMGLFAIRYLHHLSAAWRLAAALAIACLVVLVVSLNLLIAHYREAFALAAGSQVQFHEVLQSVALHPLSLNDARSWLLGALGLVINVFSAYKFFKLDDPHPGFGAIAARAEKERQALARTRRECIQILTDHRNDATESMQDAIDKVTQRRRDFEVALRARNRLHNQFCEYVEGLERACAMLGDIYRERLGTVHRQPLSAQLPRPDEIESAFSPSSGSHDRAIQTMSHYIDQISLSYKKVVAAIGDSNLEVSDAAAKI